ncbi:ComEC/Rec2 family competence protein [Saprospira grandis]|uniref:Metallo-beta-lactamase family protein n=1 Tax=Saprospira grandis (strain Lewin) TaxID=984262 RepID=H6L7J6_SAPGL|nr:MBL fold metallo-hydrolase [Saprospira grandis]AFC23028.1 metallo-beta-lactamase family protein [Saprospira grandis str. Lewin]
MSLKIKFLPAGGGDSIFIEHKFNGAKIHILLDGGSLKTYRGGIKPILKGFSETDKLDLVIVTHLHNDHTGGIKGMLEDENFDISLIKEFWMNNSDKILLSPNENKDYMGRKQYLNIQDKLGKHNIKPKTIIAGHHYTIGDLTIDVISPSQEQQDIVADEIYKWERGAGYSSNKKSRDHNKKIDDFDLSAFEPANFKEDNSIWNKSSIAFLLSYKEIKFLFTADAVPSQLISGLQTLLERADAKIDLELLKVSHHASQHNTSNEFLKMINTNKFIICTNGILQELPDKKTIAGIVKSPYREGIEKKKIDIFFTEDTKYLRKILDVDPESVQDDHNFKLHFPENGEVICFEYD